MEFIMDMVHHNPGETPFKTKFLNPKILKDFGYNAQVFKHINAAVTFEEFDKNLFADSPEALEWIKNLKKNILEEIKRAKEAGLKVYYHIDLFVLPKALCEKYKDEICDKEGKISLHKEKTLEVHRVMLSEIFKNFPIDGIIVRVGETYLYDTPYHTGNGAVKYGNIEEEKASYVKLIDFLREEICIKHDKYLFFRTWSFGAESFHGSREYYLSVMNKIEPHEKLIMSIKHTKLDFWRYIKFNECLGEGKHKQIVEVQCQREYEGKGAYPSYVMNGVINSFCENSTPKGIRDIVNNPIISGVYTWTRGGGFYGPYPKNEFWPEMNAYVIAKYAEDPSRCEEEIFNEYALDILKLPKEDLHIWRKLCLTVNNAILRSKYVDSFSKILKEEDTAVEMLWLRDDKIGGLRQLSGMFEYLYQHDLLDDALIEKNEGVLLWKEIARLYEKVHIPDRELSEFIKTSIEYAVLLFGAIYCAWNVMSIGYKLEKEHSNNVILLKEALEEYDVAWNKYKSLENNEYSSTLYEDKFLWDEGLGETIEYFRKLI